MGRADWQITPFSLPFLLIGLLCAWTAYVSWRRRSVPEAAPFAVLMAAIAGWTLLDLVEKSLVNYEWRRAVSTLSYVCIVTTPAAWLAFAVIFSRQDRPWVRRAWPLLFIHPALVLGLAFTDSRHGLFRATTEMTMDGPYAVMSIRYGPLFWPHAAYTYALFSVGAVFVVLGAARRRDATPGRLLVLLAGMIVPTLGNVAYVFRLQPERLGDLTPAYFAFTGLAAAWMLFHVRIFDVLPLARDFVLDCLHDPVIVLDQRYCVLDLNPAARALLPDPSWRVRKRPLAEVFPDLNREIPPGARGRAVTTEIHLPLAGKARFWEMHVRPMVDHYAALGVLVRLSDVTERRRAEESLLLSRNQFQSLATLSPVGIFQTDSAGDCLYVNERWCEIAGTAAKAASSKGWISHLHPDDRERVCLEWYGAVQSGVPFRLEYRFQRADGAANWVLGQALPERDFSGQIVGYVGTITDITERKQADEGRVRLLASEQAARAAAERLLWEAHEAEQHKDEFLAMLGHELRNPLAPIWNAVSLLSMPGDSAAVEQARQVLERQVRHLTRLVDDLLDVSRIAQGKVGLKQERLDLARLIGGAVEDQRDRCEAAGLALTLEMPEAPIWVHGDPTRLAQVLDNLLVNAAKFTDPGGRIVVQMTQEPQENRVRISVRDTGVGMEPSVLARLFEAFAQGDRSLERSQGGLGLGLALVQGLVRLHGGEVKADSEGLGRGSVFTFWLPLDHAGDEAADQSPAASCRGQCLRILVIEDNRDTADTLCTLLRSAGHEVAVAYSGPAGLEAAREFRPEVVLSDLGLPGMDGYAVAQALRRDPAVGEARLIAVSGYGQAEDERRAREAGFDLHLTKPLEMEQLLQVLAASPAVRC
jgi:PAS domain S-box-containing protein